MAGSGWITYREDVNMQSIDEWLDVNLPSQVYREDCVAWLCVRRPEESDDSVSDMQSRLQILQEAWCQIQANGTAITKQSISDLASMSNILYGKWLFYVATGDIADSNWKTVAHGVVKSLIPNAESAKISSNENPKNSPGNKEHVICVYNKNFLNTEEVMAVEKGLRDIGINCWMCYKPDVYTYLNIYTNNKWGLKPTIYHSNVNKSTGQSKVTVS